MSKEINISDSEWQIMRAIWEKPNMTLKEIAESTKDCGWSYTTIRTMVNRLCDKGIICADKSICNNFKYYAVVLEEECKIKEVKSFLNKVFDGSASLLVSMLAKDSKLSDKEQEELMNIISKMDKN